MGRGGAKNDGPVLEDEVHETTEVSEESPFPLTDVDRYNLSITDSQFQAHTWEELKQIIADNRLEVLRRWPSDLKRYMKWSAATKKEYGSIMAFVMQKRLKWEPSARSTPESGPLFDCDDPMPFKSPNDYKIMPNDWPYGLDKGIIHTIVWMKNRLQVQPPQGDLTEGARKLVADFVQRQFVEPTSELTGGDDNVLWFKNWVSLQSVPGIDHIHVLIRNVPQNTVDERWTRGEKPLQKLVSVSA